MKITLKYKLPDEQYDCNIAVNGKKYHSVLYEFSEWLRSRIKYDSEGMDIDTLEKIREVYNEMLEENYINLDEIS